MNVTLLIQMALSFLKIGAFSFGGGYAILPVIRREVVTTMQWISDGEFLNILSISQVTPGPVAINTSTYVGYKVAGVLGAAVATFSVVLVCFCLSVLLAGKLQKHRNHPMIRRIFSVLRPIVVALVLSAAVSTGRTVDWDWRGFVIGAVAAIQLLRLKHKVYTVMIVAGSLGVVLYGFFI